MSLKNYRAFTMAEALAAVKSDLGPDAIVLHTRTFTQGGFLGFGKKMVVEVTAAAASDMAPPPKVEERASRRGDAVRAYGASAISTRVAPTTPTAAVPPAESGSLNLDRERTRLLAQAMAVKLEREQANAPRTSAAGAAAANASATAVAAGATPVSPVAQRYVLVPAKPEGRPSVEKPRPTAPAAPPPASGTEPPAGDDLAAIERLVNAVLRRGGVEARHTSGSPASSHPGRLAELYTALIAQEVGDELAERIVNDVRGSLSAEELANDHAVRSAAIERIAALVPRCQALVPGNDGAWRRGSRPLTVAFVGPTGVGKTTTVAKIAATLKLRHGAKVGLITCDTYRIAAVDQLRTYAEIIGLELEVVLSPGQMLQACRKLGDHDVLLIDTAGRSQNDVDRIGELQALIAAAEPHETHLVLSSVASEKVLLREAAAFSAVGVDKVVVTKLDEAASLGTILRVLKNVGRSVSYMTTGQEVPQHLEAARPQRLAELVLAPPASGQPVCGGVATS